MRKYFLIFTLIFMISSPVFAQTRESITVEKSIVEEEVEKDSDNVKVGTASTKQRNKKKKNKILIPPNDEDIILTLDEEKEN